MDERTPAGIRRATLALTGDEAVADAEELKAKIAEKQALIEGSSQ